MIQLVSKLVRITLILTLIFNGCGSVLCYGNDGHIAVEPIFHNHCDHDHEHKHENRTEHEDIETHLKDKCSPCVDILISTDVGPIRTQLQPLHNESLLNGVVVNSIDSLGTTNTHREDIFSFFRPLKTIVLLT